MRLLNDNPHGLDPSTRCGLRRYEVHAGQRWRSNLGIWERAQLERVYRASAHIQPVARAIRGTLEDDGAAGLSGIGVEARRLPARAVGRSYGCAIEPAQPAILNADKHLGYAIAINVTQRAA